MGDHDRTRTHRHLDDLVAQRDGNRVAVAEHGDPCLGVGSGVNAAPGVELVAGQGFEMWALCFPVLTDGVRPEIDPPSILNAGAAPAEFRQFGPTRHLGNGHQVVAPEVPDLAFDAALLVRARQAGLAEHGIEQVVRAQENELFVLLAVAAAEHLLHRQIQVVVPDGGEDAVEALECLDVGFQEGLLREAAHGEMEGLAATARPHLEEVDLLATPREIHQGLAEVDFGLPAGLVMLGHHDRGDVDRLALALPDVLADGPFRNGGPVLGGQSRENAPCGVALLARRRSVLFEDGVDDRLPRTQDRLRRLVRLPQWRNRIGQRMADIPPVTPMLTGQPPSSPAMTVMIPSNSFVEIHLVAHSRSPCPPASAGEAADGALRVGPKPIAARPSGGARLVCRSQAFEPWGLR
jgi:hypothetical protein